VLHLGAKFKTFESGTLTAEAQDGKPFTVKADTVLVTVGRRPRPQGWGLQSMGVDMDGRFVRVDDQCRTSMKNVWAIGDLVGEPMLEHKAAAQGELVAELIAGHRRRFDPVAIPAVCFTEPEIVSVGLSPSEAEASGSEVITSQFPLAANGRALSMEAGDSGGFVRVVTRKADHRILGIQAVGAHISELSGEFALALEMGATLEDIAGVIHAHPTLSEAFFEASLSGLGHAIHM
jgi:dihydrolipoamide dehydrogenase